MTYAIHHALGASVNSIHYEAYYDTGNITLTFIGLLCLLLARPSSAVGCRRWAVRMNVYHCFLSLTHSTAWRILLPFCISSLLFYVHLFFGLPRVLVPVTMVSSAFAGNLELSIHLTWPNHCNLHLAIFCTNVYTVR